jgi:hypothetical protein
VKICWRSMLSFGKPVKEGAGSGKVLEESASGKPASRAVGNLQSDGAKQYRLGQVEGTGKRSTPGLPHLQNPTRDSDGKENLGNVLTAKTKKVNVMYT